MKKSSPSARVPAGRKGTVPGPFIEPGTGAAEVNGPGRQDVRQETHRVNVPKQSERAPERSNQRRSRRPV